MTAAIDPGRGGNDRHRHCIPLLVALVFVALAWVWTPFLDALPFPGLDRLRDHDLLGRIFVREGYLRSFLWMHRDAAAENTTQIALLLGLSFAGFLLSYYLPLRYKRPPLALLTLTGIGILLGPTPMALFLGWHLLAYASFHPAAITGRRRLVVCGVLALCLWMPWLYQLWLAPLQGWAGLALTWVAITVGLGQVWVRWVQGRHGHLLQGLVAHSALLWLALAWLYNAFAGGNTFLHPLGWLLFFWQWERVVMYYLDLRDGKVPDQLSPLHYLATFMSPATLANFHWLSRIPLGYAYLNKSFYARDKNLIALSGLALIGWAVFFGTLRPVVLELVPRGFQAFGVQPVTSYDAALAVMARSELSAGSAWCALLSAFLSFYLLWTAVAHMKVGLWRLFGYDIEPYFQKPFLATNLVELWKRYSYYYREFLVRAFYFPVFFRLAGMPRAPRIFLATFAAAGIGNLVYHLLYAGLYYGATPAVMQARLDTWPYYVLLGSGIAFTQVWLLSRARRSRPWQRGSRILLDVAAVIGTLGFFVLIRPFHHVPMDDTIGDALRLVSAALGFG